MHNYDTLTAAVEGLDARGYKYDFNLAGNGIESKELGLHLMPESFQIDEFYRFEGMTDPADSAVIYAIATLDGTLKGVLIDAYGVYENISPEMLDKLKMHHKKK